MVDFGKMLTHHRKKRGLTQADVGLLLNVTFQQVQKYELNSNRISVNKLHILLVEWNMTYEDFCMVNVVEKIEDQASVRSIKYFMNLSDKERKTLFKIHRFMKRLQKAGK